MTIAKRIVNLGSYSGPTLSAAISARHFRVRLRKSGASRNYNGISIYIRYSTTTYSVEEDVDYSSLEDVSERDPVHESEKGLECGPDERCLLRLLKDFLTELEDFGELGAHLIFEVLRFRLRHLVGRIIENLLRQKLEDDHVVLA
jgi:hypothetical protein